MKEMKFVLEYDASIEDVVDEISTQLNKIGLNIEFDTDGESNDGEVKYEIIKIPCQY